MFFHWQMMVYCLYIVMYIVMYVRMAIDSYHMLYLAQEKNSIEVMYNLSAGNMWCEIVFFHEMD